MSESNGVKENRMGTMPIPKLRCAFIYALVIMFVVLVCLELIPEKVLLLFNASKQMLNIGIPAMRIMSLSYFVSAIGIVFAAIFQGLGNGVFSMYLAFMRQVILLIPFLLLAAWMNQLNLVWGAFTLAEAIAIPFGILLYKRIMIKITMEMQNNIEVNVEV